MRFVYRNGNLKSFFASWYIKLTKENLWWKTSILDETWFIFVYILSGLNFALYKTEYCFFCMLCFDLSFIAKFKNQNMGFCSVMKKHFVKMLNSKRPVCVNTGRQNVRRVNKTTRRHDEGLQNPISERTTSFGQHLCMARNWKFLLLTWKLTLLEYTPAVQSCRGRLRRVT